MYVTVSITSRELQTSRFGLVSAGEANVSVSFRSRAFNTSRAHLCYLQELCVPVEYVLGRHWLRSPSMLDVSTCQKEYIETSISQRSFKILWIHASSSAFCFAQSSSPDTFERRLKALGICFSTVINAIHILSKFLWYAALESGSVEVHHAPAPPAPSGYAIQGFGLGLESRRLGLETVSRRQRLVSVSSRSRPFTCRSQDKFSAKL